MLKDYLKRLQQPDQTLDPLLNFMGIKVEEISSERSVVSLPFQRGFVQGAGVVSGGVITTLADEAMAQVVIANLGEGETTTTIEMSSRFLRPVTGGEVRAEGRIVKKGKRVCAVQADVTDESGELVARVVASFLIIKITEQEWAMRPPR